MGQQQPPARRPRKVRAPPEWHRASRSKPCRAARTGRHHWQIRPGLAAMALPAHESRGERPPTPGVRRNIFSFVVHQTLKQCRRCTRGRRLFDHRRNLRRLRHVGAEAACRHIEVLLDLAMLRLDGSSVARTVQHDVTLGVGQRPGSCRTDTAGRADCDGGSSPFHGSSPEETRLTTRACRQTPPDASPDSAPRRGLHR